MTTLYVILLVLAAAMFALSTLSVEVRRVNLVSLGLLFWVLVPLIQTIKVL